ncbi:MAG: hypothetical protein ACXVKP_19735, partial [Ilumatobacteraceae bacterium]
EVLVTAWLSEHADVECCDVTDPDERRRVGDVMGQKYQWDGDPSIGLTRQAWCYEVPVLAISEWR